MRCTYCARPVKVFNFRRRNLIKKLLPRCGACHRYVLTPLHKLALALFACAGFLALLWLFGLL